MLSHYGRVFQNDSRTQSRKRQAGKMVDHNLDLKKAYERAGMQYPPKTWVTDKDREAVEYYGGHVDDPDIDIGLLMIKLGAVGMIAVGLIGFGMLFL